MADQAPEATSKSGGNFVFMALAALNLIAGCAGMFLVYKGTLGYHYPSVSNRQMQAQQALKQELARPAPVLYTMSPIIVNLAGRPQRAMRVALSIQMLNQNGFEEIMNRGPEVRAKVISILESKSYNDIKTIQDKLYLKDQISVAINHFLKRGMVKDVYYTDFVVE